MEPRDAFPRVLATGVSRRGVLAAGGLAAGLAGAGALSRADAHLQSDGATPVASPVASPVAPRPVIGSEVPAVNLAALGPLPVGALKDYTLAYAQTMILDAIPLLGNAQLPGAVLNAAAAFPFDAGMLSVLGHPSSADATKMDRSIVGLTLVARRMIADWSPLFTAAPDSKATATTLGEQSVGWVEPRLLFYADGTVQPAQCVLFSHGPYVHLLAMSANGGSAPGADDAVAAAKTVADQIELALSGALTPALAAVLPAVGVGDLFPHQVFVSLVAIDGAPVPNQFGNGLNGYQPILDAKGTIVTGGVALSDPLGRDLVLGAFRPDLASQVSFASVSTTLSMELYLFPPGTDLSPIVGGLDDLLQTRYPDWTFTAT
jgi:hypothetical protein